MGLPMGALTCEYLPAKLPTTAILVHVDIEGREWGILTWRRVIADGEDRIHARTAGAASSLSQIGLSSCWVAVEFQFALGVAVVRVASDLGG